MNNEGKFERKDTSADEIDNSKRALLKTLKTSAYVAPVALMAMSTKAAAASDIPL